MAVRLGDPGLMVQLPAHLPSRTLRHLASAVSHRRMVRSPEVEAKRWPSGEKRQNFTGPEEGQGAGHGLACSTLAFSITP